MTQTQNQYMNNNPKIQNQLKEHDVIQNHVFKCKQFKSSSNYKQLFVNGFC